MGRDKRQITLIWAAGKQSIVNLITGQVEVKKLLRVLFHLCFQGAVGLLKATPHDRVPFPEVGQAEEHIPEAFRWRPFRCLGKPPSLRPM
jgi:hypothetical protein